MDTNDKLIIINGVEILINDSHGFLEELGEDRSVFINLLKIFLTKDKNKREYLDILGVNTIEIDAKFNTGKSGAKVLPIRMFKSSEKGNIYYRVIKYDKKFRLENEYNRFIGLCANPCGETFSSTSIDFIENEDDEVALLIYPNYGTNITNLRELLKIIQDDFKKEDTSELKDKIYNILEDVLNDLNLCFYNASINNIKHSVFSIFSSMLPPLVTFDELELELESESDFVRSYYYADVVDAMLIDFEKIGKNHWKNKCLMRLDDLGILDHPRFRRELSLLDHPGFRRELSRVDIKSSRFPSEIPIPIPTRLVKEKVLITGRRMYQSRLPFYNFYRRFDHLLTPLAEKTLDSYLWAERLHNDLNPGNILIAEMNDGRKRGIVIDFYSAGVSGHLFTDLVRLESLIIIEYLLNIDCKEKEIIEQIENRLFYLGDYRNTWLTRLFYSGDYRNTRLNQNLLNILDIAIKIRKIGIRWGIDLKQRDDTIYKNYLYAKYLFLISFQKISETDDSIRIKKDIALDFAIVLRDIIDKYEKREISVNLRELCRDSENLEPEGLLSQLRSRMHKANSIQELREIESKIEEFLHEHPHNSEATRLKDDVLKKQLSIFRRKMLEARSIELEQLLFEIDEFLHAHPYNAEARLLKKQVLTAIQKEKRESMDYRYMIPTSRKPGLIYQIAKALIAKALTAMAIIACLVFIILNLIPHSRASYPVIRSAYYNVKKQELNILTSGNHSKIKPDSLEFYARCEPGRADCFNGIQTPIKDGVHYIKNEPGCSACFHGVQTPIKNGVHYIKKCPDIDKCYKAVIQYTGLDGKDFKVVKEIEFRTSDGKESCEVEITTPDNSVVQDNNSLPIEESFSFTIQGKVKNLGSNKVCVYQKVPCGATWWRSGEPIGRDDLGPDGVWTMTYASCGKKGNPHSSCMVKAMVKEVCEPSDAEVSDLGDRICESATYTYKTKP